MPGTVTAVNSTVTPVGPPVGLIAGIGIVVDASVTVPGSTVTCRVA